MDERLDVTVPSRWLKFSGSTVTKFSASFCWIAHIWRLHTLLADEFKAQLGLFCSSLGSENRYPHLRQSQR
jgi:hypothetical protein